MTMNNDPRIDEARELLLILAGNDEAWLDRVIAADKDKYGTISITRVVAMLTDATRVDKDAEISRLRLAERMNVDRIAALHKERDELEAVVSRHLAALDIIANSEFEMKVSEAIKLMRRTAYEALKGGDQWHEKKQ